MPPRNYSVVVCFDGTANRIQRQSPLQGDFGVSFRHRQDAMSIVLERMPATLVLGAAALAVSLLIAVPAGVVGASRLPGGTST